MQFSVLIVDDCPGMQMMIRRIIGMSGLDMVECYTACDGRQALDMMRRHPVDLVISDVNMPHLDGEAMLQRMSQEDALRSIPVLMVSSDATKSRSTRLLSMGARGYIAKPFQPEELRAELERILEGPDA
jgi:two-component system, chemotaxis family, chemotaxis protein CheY